MSILVLLHKFGAETNGHEGPIISWKIGTWGQVMTEKSGPMLQM